MKTVKIVDGSTKSDLPSMKRAKNMDGQLENKFSSTKSAEIVDGNTKPDLSSTKKPENVDDQPENRRSIHENR